MVQIIIAGIVGVIIGVGIMWAMAKSGLDRNTTRSRLIIDEANSKAEAIDTLVRYYDFDREPANHGDIKALAIQTVAALESFRDSIIEYLKSNA